MIEDKDQQHTTERTQEVFKLINELQEEFEKEFPNQKFTDSEFFKSVKQGCELQIKQKEGKEIEDTVENNFMRLIFSMKREKKSLSELQLSLLVECCSRYA